MRTHTTSKTSEAVREAIRASDESVRALARRYQINPKTVLKWKHRTFSADAFARRDNVHKSLAPVQESLVASFRHVTRLPLDDCLYALREIMPELSRSTLHRCLQKHGLSRLPDTPTRLIPDNCPDIGHFEMVCVPTTTAHGTFLALVATDPATRVLFGMACAIEDTRQIAGFSSSLAEFLPYPIKSIRAPLIFAAAQGRECQLAGDDSGDRDETDFTDFMKSVMRDPVIAARLKNAVEINSGEVRYSTSTDVQTQMHVYNWKYNFTRRLKIIGGKTTFEYISMMYAMFPHIFVADPRLWHSKVEQAMASSVAQDGAKA